MNMNIGLMIITARCPIINIKLFLFPHFKCGKTSICLLYLPSRRFAKECLVHLSMSQTADGMNFKPLSTRTLLKNRSTVCQHRPETYNGFHLSPAGVISVSASNSHVQKHFFRKARLAWLNIGAGMKKINYLPCAKTIICSTTQAVWGKLL